MAKLFFALATIGHPEGAILPGNRITDGKFPQEQLERFLRKGYVEVVETDEPVKEKAPNPEGGGNATPAWNFKTEDLAGKKIEELNMLIVERAQVMRFENPPTFDDVETAIEFMTSEA